jgi:hypothetical protein
MSLMPCPECGTEVSSKAVACPKCGCPIASAQAAAAAVAPPVPIGPIKYVYAGSLVLGLSIAAYIYLLNFEELSETTLVQLTPVWFFFIVLGYYGLVAERMLVRKEASRSEAVADTLFEMIKATAPGPVGKLFAAFIHLPFAIVKSRKSWVVAVVGALVWAVALAIFFEVIFPQL